MSADVEPDAPGPVSQSVEARLNLLLIAAGIGKLQASESKSFNSYISLIIRWNARVNLTAVRDEDGILARHFVESIACAHALPDGITTLLDFGSGAGFPGIPIAICRPEIAVTVAESQGKKAAFLQEAARVLDLPITVYSSRAETLPPHFDCVTLRAVDKMAIAVHAASHLVRPGGWLALMTTGSELPGLKIAAGSSFQWTAPTVLLGGEERIVVFGARPS